MNEANKPKQFWIINQSIGDGVNLVENTYLGTSDKPTEKIIKQFGETKFIHVIELDPTLQLMKEMGESLNAIWGHTEDCSDSEEYFEEGETCDCGFILVERAYNKYRNFKELLK